MLSMRPASIFPTLLILSLLAFALSPPASAQSDPLTAGPNLAQLSDSNQIDCSSNPFTSSPISSPSCTWASLAKGSGSTALIFGTGTINQVSVKVGPTTGAMKAVVMREEVELSFTNEGQEPHERLSCCTDVAESQVFTPTANSTTTVPVELPVTIEFHPVNPQTLILKADLLGLSVLEDGVPVPAAAGVHETEEAEGPEGGPGGKEVQPETFVEQPAMQANGQLQTAQAGKGYLLLMDAAWTPTPSTQTGILGPLPGSTPGPETPPGLTPDTKPTAATPTLTFPAGSPLVLIRGNDALVRLACGAAPCTGAVHLQSGPHAKATSAQAIPTAGKHKQNKPSKLTTYATGDFSLAAHKSQTVKVKLSSTGRKLAREHKRLRVWINVTPTGAGPTMILSRSEMLRF
jgi:hypothetical protein